MDDATQRAVARTMARPACECLEPQYSGKPWRELQLHFERQDTECEAWRRLLQLVDQAADDKSDVFEPGADLAWEDWIKITTLPASIARLTHVRELRLYGSNLVRLPAEIGAMAELRVLDLYTSYRLHWLPYEVTRCSKLEESRLSTRALYGNYKYRPPFPRLSPYFDDFAPDSCSVCDQPFGGITPIQVWISLRVATDVMPLMVHACSIRCIESLPKPPDDYPQAAHKGGVGLAQPSVRF